MVIPNIKIRHLWPFEMELYTFNTPRFNTKMSYQYRNSHYKDKTVIRQLYFIFMMGKPILILNISMASFKTAATPLLTPWSYCSLALSHIFILKLCPALWHAFHDNSASWVLAQVKRRGPLGFGLRWWFLHFDGGRRRPFGGLGLWLHEEFQFGTRSLALS